MCVPCWITSTFYGVPQLSELVYYALLPLSSQPAAAVLAGPEEVVEDDVVLLALVAALDAARGDLVHARVGRDHLVPERY